MFHFQTLDVYKCAVAFLPVAYSLSKLGDAELASQLRRAALSIKPQHCRGNRPVWEDERKLLVTARGSALESAAALDALAIIGVTDSRIAEGHALLVRIVSMLTKMIG